MMLTMSIVVMSIDDWRVEEPLLTDESSIVIFVVIDIVVLILWWWYGSIILLYRYCWPVWSDGSIDNMTVTVDDSYIYCSVLWWCSIHCDMLCKLMVSIDYSDWWWILICDLVDCYYWYCWLPIVTDYWWWWLFLLWLLGLIEGIVELLTIPLCSILL